MRLQALLAGMLLLLPSLLWPQTDRPSCAKVIGPTNHLPSLPEPMRWQGRFADTVAGLLLDAPPPDAQLARVDSSMTALSRQRIENLWKEEPFQVKWSLAMLSVDPSRATTDLARNASRWYRFTSGEADPILRLLEGMGDQSYRSIGLRAIKPPVTAMQELLIFRYACDAAWLLEALAADTAYHRMVQKRQSHVWWPKEALADLYASERLVTNQRHIEVEQMIRRARDILATRFK